MLGLGAILALKQEGDSPAARAYRDDRRNCPHDHVQHLRKTWFIGWMGIARVRQGRIKRRTAASLEPPMSATPNDCGVYCDLETVTYQVDGTTTSWTVSLLCWSGWYSRGWNFERSTGLRHRVVVHTELFANGFSCK